MVVRVIDRRWQDLEKDNIPLGKLTRHFETHNRSEGKSSATVYSYSRVLSYFHNYLREHISRVYRRKAIELVTEEFLSLVNNGR